MNSIAIDINNCLDDLEVFDMVQSFVDDLCRGGKRMVYASAEGLTTQRSR